MVTAIEALENVEWVKAELTHQDNIIKELRDKLYSLKAVDYGTEPIQGGGAKDLSNQVAEFEERLNKVMTKKAKLLAYIDCIEGMIEQVRPVRLKVLLYERYIKGEKWEDVAGTLKLSRQWVREELKPQALEEFEKIFKIGLHDFALLAIEI